MIDRKPTLCVVAGPNGSGKTTTTVQLLNNEWTADSLYKEQGKEMPNLEFEFIFDIGAFFSYYMINVTAFAEYAGMNASLLRQYACGLKSPTKNTIGKIRDAINKYKKDIDAGLLIDRPVPQYI